MANAKQTGFRTRETIIRNEGWLVEALESVMNAKDNPQELELALAHAHDILVLVKHSRKNAR
jgi:hypothetical protein